MNSFSILHVLAHKKGELQPLLCSSFVRQGRSFAAAIVLSLYRSQRRELKDSDAGNYIDHPAATEDQAILLGVRALRKADTKLSPPDLDPFNPPVNIGGLSSIAVYVDFAKFLQYKLINISFPQTHSR